MARKPVSSTREDLQHCVHVLKDTAFNLSKCIQNLSSKANSNVVPTDTNNSDTRYHTMMNARDLIELMDKRKINNSLNNPKNDIAHCEGIKSHAKYNLEKEFNKLDNQLTSTRKPMELSQDLNHFNTHKQFISNYPDNSKSISQNNKMTPQYQDPRNVKETKSATMLQKKTLYKSPNNYISQTVTQHKAIPTEDNKFSTINGRRHLNVPYIDSYYNKNLELPTKSPHEQQHSIAYNDASNAFTFNRSDGRNIQSQYTSLEHSLPKARYEDDLPLYNSRSCGNMYPANKYNIADKETFSKFHTLDVYKQLRHLVLIINDLLQKNKTYTEASSGPVPKSMPICPHSDMFEMSRHQKSMYNENSKNLCSKCQYHKKNWNYPKSMNNTCDFSSPEKMTYLLCQLNKYVNDQKNQITHIENMIQDLNNADRNSITKQSIKLLNNLEESKMTQNNQKLKSQLNNTVEIISDGFGNIIKTIIQSNINSKSNQCANNEETDKLEKTMNDQIKDSVIVTLRELIANLTMNTEINKSELKDEQPERTMSKNKEVSPNEAIK